MYKFKLSRREKKKLLRVKWLIMLGGLVVAVLIVWLVWIRPVQRESGIGSFEECVAAGNPVQESYPEVCMTKDGKRFVNPKQDAAHQASLDGSQQPVPPANPALLKLDIGEWGVRIPLTMETFDLTYAYFDFNGEQYLLFTYKRLLQLGVCKGDIGLRLTRTTHKRDPPYTAVNPAPIAQVDTHYFYVTPAEGSKLCYDDKNAEHAALVSQIAGGKPLTQATADLLAKIIATP